MGLVGTLGCFGRVEVNVDHIVECPDSGVDRFLELLVVDVAVLVQVLVEDDAAEVAHGGFIVARVERNLGTEVGRMDHADVVLW